MSLVAPSFWKQVSRFGENLSRFFEQSALAFRAGI